MLAIIVYGLGTAPFEHGLVCWAVGTILVVALRYVSKWETHEWRKRTSTSKHAAPSTF